MKSDLHALGVIAEGDDLKHAAVFASEVTPAI